METLTEITLPDIHGIMLCVAVHGQGNSEADCP